MTGIKACDLPINLIETPIIDSITIGDIVRISLKDGSIERLPNFTTLDAAALGFWDAVERFSSKRLHAAEEQMREAFASN